jgi:hypothetical protein
LAVGRGTRADRMSFEAQGKPQLPGSFLPTAGTAVPCPYHGLGGAHGAALLKAFTAENWAALGRAEGDSGVLAALGAGGFGLGTHLRSAATTVGADALRALGLATFATFGFVFEALVGEEHLLAGSKDKLRTTFRTLQDLIVEFHEPLPLAQFEQGERRTLHHRAGCRIPRSGGNRARPPWGLRVRAATQTQLLCLSRVYITEVRRWGLSEEGSGGPDQRGRSRRKASPLPAAAFCAVASAKALL